MSQTRKLLLAMGMLAGTAGAELAQTYSVGPIKVESIGAAAPTMPKHSH